MHSLRQTFRGKARGESREPILLVHRAVTLRNENTRFAVSFREQTETRETSPRCFAFRKIIH